MSSNIEEQEAWFSDTDILELPTRTRKTKAKKPCDPVIGRQNGIMSINCRALEEAIQHPDPDRLSDNMKTCLSNIVRASLTPWRAIPGVTEYCAKGTHYQVYTSAISWLAQHVMNISPTVIKFAYVTAAKHENVLSGVPSTPPEIPLLARGSIRAREKTAVFKMYKTLFTAPIMSIEPGCACWGEGEGMVREYVYMCVVIY